MIVDDEAVVREGIRDRIDWTGLGFRVAGVYEDGRAALEAIRSRAPDAILTDIRMPFVDGIELTRLVAEEFPTTRVLLLTGHDEFEYAQEAVRLQAWDFLLKPISSRELTDVLRRLASDLDTEYRRRREEEQLRRQWEASLPLLRERALNDLVGGQTSLDEALQRLEDLGIVLEPGRVRVVLVSPDPHEVPDPDSAAETAEDRFAIPAGLRDLAIANHVSEALAGAGIAAQWITSEGDIAVILTGADRDVSERLDTLRRRIPDTEGGSVTIAIGPAYGRLGELRRSYQGARRRLMQRFLTGGNRVIVSEDAPAGGEARGQDRGGGPSELVVRLRIVDREGTLQALDEMIEQCRTRRHAVKQCVLDLQRDLARVLDAAEALDVAFETILADGTNPFEELARQPSLDAIHRWFRALVVRILDALEERVQTQAELKIRAAEEYLRKHFRDSSLSLTAVCADLSVSVSYFSQRFKTITGKTFVEYLTELRIEQAKELLRTGAGRGYEIAPQVGFRDPHYFSSTFKKVCGMTPTQYRNRYGEQA